MGNGESRIDDLVSEGVLDPKEKFYGFENVSPTLTS